MFSSTAAVYGNPEYTPIDEAHPTRPINPYGWSKLMAERAIEECCRAYGMRAVSLRYFNAAGADSEGEIGEAHDPETHLIPNIIMAALDPSRGPVKIFGNDYDTPDGTCIRDYIHVEDLCEAHFARLGLFTTQHGLCPHESRNGSRQFRCRSPRHLPRATSRRAAIGPRPPPAWRSRHSGRQWGRRDGNA